MRFQIPLLFLVSLIPFLLVGCGPGGTAVERGDRDQILHVNLGVIPESLDPHLTTSVAGYTALSALLEGLVNEDPHDLSPIPGVAERWEISDDQLEYTFFLRENARWSNGDPVTADDFLFSFQRMLSPALGAKYAYMLFPAKNAEAFHQGEVDFSEVGFEAVDDLTLKIRLEHPTAYFLSLLNNSCWWPVHPPTILAHGRIDEPATHWSRAKNFVGNGPFSLTEWEIGRPIRTEPNPHYWDAKTVRLNGIVFHSIESLDTEERAFLSGQLHATNNIPADRINHYLENFPELLHSHPLFGVYFYRINVEHEPFNDSRVRRAISLAIDQEAIVKSVIQGHFDPAFHFTPPTSDYVAEAQIGFNVEKARELLAEAGYPNGEGFPSFDLLFNTQEAHRRIAEAIQQMLRTNLNIRVELYNQEWQTFLSSVASQNYHIARGSWIGDYLDPNSFLDLWITDGGNNNTGWSNPQYDELILKAARTADPKVRLDYFQKAEEILIEESPVIPIYHYMANYLLRPSVKNWHPNRLDRHPFKYIYLDPES